MLLESQSNANHTRCPIKEIPLATELQALNLMCVDSRMPEHHRWHSRLGFQIADMHSGCVM